ncbi:unnamed protein product [Coccothraustes coccothraustes]
MSCCYGVVACRADCGIAWVVEEQTFISVVWSGWLEGSISRSSLQFHFLQTLEHRTDVSVTSTSPWWEAPEEQGPVLVPLGLETFGSVAQRHPLSCIPASAAFCSLAWS